MRWSTADDSAISRVMRLGQPHNQCETSCIILSPPTTFFFLIAACVLTHDIWKVHDVSIWFASGRYQLLQPRLHRLSTIWLRWVAADSHMCLERPVILRNTKMEKTDIALCYTLESGVGWLLAAVVSHAVTERHHLHCYLLPAECLACEINWRIYQRREQIYFHWLFTCMRQHKSYLTPNII